MTTHAGAWLVRAEPRAALLLGQRCAPGLRNPEDLEDNVGDNVGTTCAHPVGISTTTCG